MDTIEQTPPSRVRAVFRTAAGPFEVLSVLAVTILAWRLALGWNWSSVPTPVPGDDTPPQTSFDWTVFGIIAMLSVGWLALRGRAVAGTVGVCLPAIALSGWRMAVSGAVDWPVGLASLVFSLSATSMAAAVIGAWLRYRGACRRR